MTGELGLQAVSRPFASTGVLEFAPSFDARIEAKSRWLTLAFAPRLLVAVDHESGTTRSRVLPREAWLRVAAGPVDVQAGLREFDWGISTLKRPANPLEQLHYGAGFFRLELLPDLALSAKLTLSPFTVEAAWIPIYRRPNWPTGDDVLGIRLGALGALNLDVSTGWLPIDEVDANTMTFAARVHYRGPVDVSLVWMRGPSRLPAPALDDLTLRDLTSPHDVLAGTISATLWDVVLHAEAAWLSTDRTKRVFLAAEPYPWTEPIPDSYLSWTTGIEWTLWDLFADADLTLTAEYAGEVRPYLDAQAALRPWQNDLYLGATLRLDDVDDTRVALATIVDLSHADTVVRVSAGRHLGADLVLTVDAVVLMGTKDDDAPLSLTTTLADRDSFGARLSWFF